MAKMKTKKKQSLKRVLCADLLVFDGITEPSVGDGVRKKENRSEKNWLYRCALHSAFV
jgi:hypothetical protein